MEHARQLLTACEEGDVQTAQDLLDEGVGVDCSDDEENTPLQVAAANGHDQASKIMLNQLNG